MTAGATQDLLANCQEAAANADVKAAPRAHIGSAEVINIDSRSDSSAPATRNCHDPLPTPGTQPRPRDSSTPKTTPTTAPGPDRYPANSPGHHQPSPPINATATTTCGTPQPSPP
ncbi:hypothetical protein C0993_007373 [Termitomyces sp. T159_Od127]|nr:hypothetical protein C0993_007373 [Termitomyces sp. T159_Od127]